MRSRSTSSRSQRSTTSSICDGGSPLPMARERRMPSSSSRVTLRTVRTDVRWRQARLSWFALAARSRPDATPASLGRRCYGYRSGIMCSGDDGRTMSYRSRRNYASVGARPRTREGANRKVSRVVRCGGRRHALLKCAGFLGVLDAAVAAWGFPCLTSAILRRRDCRCRSSGARHSGWSCNHARTRRASSGQDRSTGDRRDGDGRCDSLEHEFSNHEVLTPASRAQGRRRSTGQHIVRHNSASGLEFGQGGAPVKGRARHRRRPARSGRRREIHDRDIRCAGNAERLSAGVGHTLKVRRAVNRQ